MPQARFRFSLMVDCGSPLGVQETGLRRRCIQPCERGSTEPSCVQARPDPFIQPLDQHSPPAKVRRRSSCIQEAKAGSREPGPTLYPMRNFAYELVAMLRAERSDCLTALGPDRNLTVFRQLLTRFAPKTGIYPRLLFPHGLVISRKHQNPAGRPAKLQPPGGRGEHRDQRLAPRFRRRTRS